MPARIVDSCDSNASEETVDVQLVEEEAFELPAARLHPRAARIHLNGHEEHSHRLNLIRNCRSCNTRLGVVFKRLGLGRRTRQFNPEARGAEKYQQWALAVMSMKGGPTP